MQVIVDNLLVHYETSGNGPVLVIVHGWADNISTFNGLIKRLSSKYKVIAVDLPGFGGSAAPQTAWTLNNYGDFVKKFLDKIDEKRVYAFIGHSNGGAIVINGLASGRLNADKLVLMASAGVRGLNKGHNVTFLILAKIGKLVTSPLPGSTKRRLKRKLYKSAGSDMLIAEDMKETFKLVVNEDVRNEAEELDLPVLLIYGENDKATPVSYGEMFHELMSNSTLEVLPGAGHFVFNDRPDDIYKIVKEFLA